MIYQVNVVVPFGLFIFILLTFSLQNFL